MNIQKWIAAHWARFAPSAPIGTAAKADVSAVQRPMPVLPSTTSADLPPTAQHARSARRSGLPLSGAVRPLAHLLGLTPQGTMAKAPAPAPAPIARPQHGDVPTPAAQAEVASRAGQRPMSLADLLGLPKAAPPAPAKPSAPAASAAAPAVTPAVAAAAAPNPPPITAPPAPPPAAVSIPAPATLTPSAASALAQAIVAAGRARRGEAPAKSIRPAAGSTAAKIVASGERRRGELPPAEPPTGLAAAVVVAGQKRRGEIAAAPPTGLAAAILTAGKKRRGEM